MRPMRTGRRSGRWRRRTTSPRNIAEAVKTSQDALAKSNGKAPEIELLVAQSLVATGKYDEAATGAARLSEEPRRPAGSGEGEALAGSTGGRRESREVN